MKQIFKLQLRSLLYEHTFSTQQRYEKDEVEPIRCAYYIPFHKIRKVVHLSNIPFMIHQFKKLELIRELYQFV